MLRFRLEMLRHAVKAWQSRLQHIRLRVWQSAWHARKERRQGQVNAGAPEAEAQEALRLAR